MIEYAVPGLILGFILGYWKGAGGRLALPPAIVTEDNNRDGKPDVFFHYAGDVLQLSEYDRNCDSKIDLSYYYSDGQLTRAEGDENFDGVIDSWDTYKDGYAYRAQSDTDWNGIPDVTYEFDHAVLSKASWHPNGAPTLRVQFFEHGVLTREEWDLDRDGIFELSSRFDAFGNKLGTDSQGKP